MKLPLLQIDAFADRLFTGNPAAVCPLESWPDDGLLQDIAAENNLAETAFLVPADGGYEIRWFTPTVEVALCGHATLAASHALMQHWGFAGDIIKFHTRESGELTVRRDGERYILNFPTDELEAAPPPTGLLDSLGCESNECYCGKTDYLVVLEDQRQLLDIEPDFLQLARIDSRGVIVTAPGVDCDFVSRCFFPQSGINEDPVTGSAHTTLTPYWAQRLGKDTMVARQLSRRGGTLYCQLLGERTEIAGCARTYLIGEINVT